MAENFSPSPEIMKVAYPGLGNIVSLGKNFLGGEKGSINKSYLLFEVSIHR